MKKLFLILSLIVILSSCSIDWNGEKDKKITELEKQIQNDTFKKKQECASYRKEVLDTLITEYIEGVIKVTDSFYSKKLDTCLYRVGLYKDVLNPGYYNDLISERLFDYLSNKNIIIYSKDNESIEYTTNEDTGKLEEKIKELKGE